LPIGDINTSKIVWGIVHSLVGLALVWRGSFALFETVMSVCVGIMFVTVIGTGFLVAPDWGAVAAGFVPTIPEGQTGWVIAVLGGVGGTLTLLSYGYWIREAGRRGKESLKLCRIDLAVGNGLTGLFGLAVIVIGSRVNLHGQGATLAIQFADQLADAIGPAGRWIFLIGFWAAVFSSVLGVWQSVPYLFADFMDLARGAKPGIRRDVDLRQTRDYRAYLLAISTLPMVFLWSPVRLIQLAYGIVGAMFLPILALTLLILNNQRRWVGSDMRSSWAINLVLAIAVLFFGYVGAGELYEQVAGLAGG
jgi:Mn2+/Fe2+ NRAMP family transporter